MNPERLKRRLKVLEEDPSNLAELGRLARDFGHSLPLATLQELRELRAECAAIRDGLDDQTPGVAFAKGLLHGLVEMAVAYDAESQSIAEREELRRFIGQGLSLRVLRELEEGPRLPRELVRVLSTSDAQISRALRDLRAVGLVDLMATAALEDQRTRPHRLTPEGRVFLKTFPAEPSGQVEAVEVSQVVEEPRPLEPLVDQVYTGTVRRVEAYGAFVEILGREGLVHTNDLAPYRVSHPSDVVKVGDEVPVKVIRIDENGRVRLSRKTAIEDFTATEEPAEQKNAAEAASPQLATAGRGSLRGR
jgi:predicted RNA-binding protein with RPS1 domain/DNA-binding HxlR family transcriptional regulator